MKHLKYLTALFVTALVALSLAPQSTKAAYYSGKTITLIVGFGPGGTNTMARFFSQHLEKHIAGNPNVIVKNMPGAGSIKAMNFLRHKARKDGRTIGFNPFQVAAQVSGARGMRFKYEDFEYVAGLQGGPGMLLARANLPSGKVKTVSDLLKAKGLKYAGRVAIHGSDVNAMATLDLLGVKYDYVSGFRGVPPMKVSLQAGETHFTGFSMGSWFKNLRPTMADKGIIVGLYHLDSPNSDGTWSPDPRYKIPSFIQVYKKLHGKAPSGPLWEAWKFYTNVTLGGGMRIFAPPGVNKEALRDLRAGFKSAATDPEVIKRMGSALGQVLKYIPVDAGIKQLETLKNVDPKIVKFWTERIASFQKQ